MDLNYTVDMLPQSNVKVSFEQVKLCLDCTSCVTSHQNKQNLVMDLNNFIHI